MRSGKLTVQAVREAMRCGDVPPWSQTGTWDLVIADESHRIQNRNSSNRRVLNLIQAGNKMALSGTPAGNRPEGLWATLNWLWPQRYRSFWEWASLYMIINDKQISRYDTVQEITGEKFPGSTFTDIPCVVRWRTQEVADQLPEVIERTVMVNMGTKQRKIYDDFESQAFAWLDEQPVMTDLPITQRIRLRQASLGQLRAKKADPGVDVGFAKTGDQPKISAVRDIISDLPDNELVLIFTHSAKWAVMCAEILDREPGSAHAWTGDLSKAQRSKLKSDFGSGVRIIVAQIASIAEGVDGLQFVCRCEIWASPSEDGLMNEQAKARLHRPGQEKIVQRWVLHSKDSIDTDVDASLKMRRAQMHAMYRDGES
jgi:superfamily II DNA or RNA helicase